MFSRWDDYWDLYTENLFKELALFLVNDVDDYFSYSKETLELIFLCGESYLYCNYVSLVDSYICKL